MIDIKDIVGKNLKRIRKDFGYSQEKLAELIGLQRKSISHIETGHSSISCDTIQKLCKVLNISPIELFISENPQTQNEKLNQTIDIISKFNDEKLDYAYRIIKAIDKR